MSRRRASCRVRPPWRRCFCPLLQSTCKETYSLGILAAGAANVIGPCQGTTWRSLGPSAQPAAAAGAEAGEPALRALRALQAAVLERAQEAVGKQVLVRARPEGAGQGLGFCGVDEGHSWVVERPTLAAPHLPFRQPSWPCAFASRYSHCGSPSDPRPATTLYSNYKLRTTRYVLYPTYNLKYYVVTGQGSPGETAAAIPQTLATGS